MDEALAALYDEPAAADRDGAAPTTGPPGWGRRHPQVARWLGDIRTYFPTSVVQVMQRDAIERLNLTALLLEPELLSTVQPDVHLVGTLVGLNSVMPETTRETARTVVAQVVGRDRAADRPSGPGPRSAGPSTGPPAPGGRDRRHRLGAPPSAATSTTTCPSTRPWSRERLVGTRRSSRALASDVIVAIDQSGLDGGVGGLRRGLRRGARLDAAPCAPRWSPSTPPWST